LKANLARRKKPARCPAKWCKAFCTAQAVRTVGRPSVFSAELRRRLVSLSAVGWHKLGLHRIWQACRPALAGGQLQKKLASAPVRATVAVMILALQC
jgi:hypothetical protein